MGTELHREKPLAIRRGILAITLDASDVNLLIEGARELARGAQNAHDRRPIEDDRLREHLGDLLGGHLSELSALAEELATASPTSRDPPLDLSRAKGRLLRQVISDLSGYQRKDLTPSLRQLRKALGEN